MKNNWVIEIEDFTLLFNYPFFYKDGKLVYLFNLILITIVLCVRTSGDF